MAFFKGSAWTLCAVLSLVGLTGCASNGIPSNETVDIPEPLAAEIEPAPTEVEPSVPSDEDVLTTETVTVTDANGYIAKITIKWHQVVNATYQELAALPPAYGTTNSNCATSLAVIVGLRDDSASPDTLTFKRVRVTGNIEYPTSAGFTWPADKPIRFGTSNAGAVGRVSTNINCGVGVVPAPEGGAFDINAVYAGVKTPNDPNPEINAALEALIFIANYGNGVETLAAYPNG